MLKILLINPPQTFYNKTQFYAEQIPLGMLFIAGVLKKENIKIDILDALREGDAFVREGKGTRYGLSWDSIAHKVENYQPDIVGISNPYSSQVLNALETARAVKNVNPAIITVVGGVHPTLAALDMINREPAIDICVRGEGEYAMRDIIRAYFLNGKGMNIKDIPGLVYRDKGAIFSTGDPCPIDKLDELPFPAYEILDMEKYLSEDFKLRTFSAPTLRVVEMVTSRGCPFNCVFCPTKKIMGSKFRAHSAEYVLNHIEYVVSKYKVRYIRFNDDNISLDYKRFYDIADGLVKRNLNIGWSCSNGIRADTLDENLLRKMKDAGCDHIFVPAEAGNQEVLDKIVDKNLDLGRVENALKLCKKIGLRADVYFMMGLPGETLYNMKQTKMLGLKFLLKYNAKPLFFTAYPSLGSRLQEICQKEGYLKEDVDAKDFSVKTQGEAIIHTDQFTPNDVTRIHNAAVREGAALRAITLLLNKPILLFKIAFRRVAREIYNIAASIRK